jgi:selenocysteine lyase/cysteine desulfurase
MQIDELIGNTDAFPVLAKRDYFNHAGVSPMPRVVGDAVRSFLQHFQEDSFVGFDFMKPLDTLRQAAADVINASTDDIAIVSNTSEAVSMIALGLDLQPGDRVVINDGEYPANVYPWTEACRRSGAELVSVNEVTTDEGHVLVREDDLIAACEHPKTKLLAVSHVQWGTGQRTDINRLGSFCRERGIRFSVDAIQSLGVVPIDVEEANVDFLQAGGHKWMLGTMGAGVLYIRRERLDELRPATVGWGSVVEPFKWESIDYTLRPNAHRYEYGSPAFAPIIAVGTGLSMLRDIGIDAVSERVTTLGDQFARGIGDLGGQSATPRSSIGVRSGAVCFTPPGGDAKLLYETLAKEHHIELASRCGRVRFAPHFYNTEEQVDRLLDRIESVLRA